MRPQAERRKTRQPVGSAREEPTNIQFITTDRFGNNPTRAPAEFRRLCRDQGRPRVVLLLFDLFQGFRGGLANPPTLVRKQRSACGNGCRCGRVFGLGEIGFCLVPFIHFSVDDTPSIVRIYIGRQTGFVNESRKPSQRTLPAVPSFRCLRRTERASRPCPRRDQHPRRSRPRCIPDDGDLRGRPFPPPINACSFPLPRWHHESPLGC